MTEFEISGLSNSPSRCDTNSTSNEVAELMAWHLAKIFRATLKKKLKREVEKLKARN